MKSDVENNLLFPAVKYLLLEDLAGYFPLKYRKTLPVTTVHGVLANPGSYCATFGGDSRTLLSIVHYALEKCFQTKGLVRLPYDLMGLEHQALLLGELRKMQLPIEVLRFDLGKYASRTLADRGLTIAWLLKHGVHHYRELKACGVTKAQLLTEALRVICEVKDWNEVVSRVSKMRVVLARLLSVPGAKSARKLRYNGDSDAVRRFLGKFNLEQIASISVEGLLAFFKLETDCILELCAVVIEYSARYQQRLQNKIYANRASAIDIKRYLTSFSREDAQRIAQYYESLQNEKGNCSLLLALYEELHPKSFIHFICKNSAINGTSPFLTTPGSVRFANHGLKQKIESAFFGHSFPLKSKMEQLLKANFIHKAQFLTEITPAEIYWFCMRELALANEFKEGRLLGSEKNQCLVRGATFEELLLKGCAELSPISGDAVQRISETFSVECLEVYTFLKKQLFYSDELKMFFHSKQDAILYTLQHAAGSLSAREISTRTGIHQDYLRRLIASMPDVTKAGINKERTYRLVNS
ncbi:MAG: hypothetical protein KDD62_03960 [Bdellovibrionales bacterium]|nr:hypothetical protein [Bdellovibrionales bacterium]